MVAERPLFGDDQPDHQARPCGPGEWLRRNEVSRRVELHETIDTALDQGRFRFNDKKHGRASATDRSTFSAMDRAG
jgi:hypothetical protein